MDSPPQHGTPGGPEIYVFVIYYNHKVQQDLQNDHLKHIQMHQQQDQFHVDKIVWDFYIQINQIRMIVQLKDVNLYKKNIQCVVFFSSRSNFFSKTNKNSRSFTQKMRAKISFFFFFIQDF